MARGGAREGTQPGTGPNSRTARGYVQRTWHEAAVLHRKALEVLGWPMPRCLPGELAPCGGTDEEHLAAYLGALEAVIHHKVAHLHLGAAGDEWVSASYRVTVDEIMALPRCPCEHEVSGG